MKKISQLLIYLFIQTGVFAQPISLHPEITTLNSKNGGQGFQNKVRTLL